MHQEIEKPLSHRMELNFLQYPYFALQTKGLREVRRVEYRQRLMGPNGEEIEVYWVVSAHQDYGYPGPFERKLHMAVEQIISEMPLPIQNPIRLGTWYQLCKRMGIAPKGDNYRKINGAINRMITAAVHCKRTFYYKPKKTWIEDVFHLYDHIVRKGENLDGSDEIADVNYLYLNSWYIDNVNSSYFKYLDYDYLKSLEPFASRLYQLLGLKFYGIRNLAGESRFIRYKYSTICMLLPATRHRHKSLARQQLALAHEHLLKTRFLDRVEWVPIPGVSGDDWYILYYPGSRFFDELERLNPSPSVVDEQLLVEEDSDQAYPTISPAANKPNNTPDAQEEKKTSPSAPVPLDQEEKPTSSLANLFYEIVKTYPEFDIRELDLQWFHKRIETNPSFESINLEDELYNWADWLETQHRKKEQHKSNRFPKSNFKASLTNWLKKAIEIARKGGFNNENNQKQVREGGGGGNGICEGDSRQSDNADDMYAGTDIPPSLRINWAAWEASMRETKTRG